MIFGKRDREKRSGGSDIYINPMDYEHILLDGGIHARDADTGNLKQLMPLDRVTLEKLIEANGGVADLLRLGGLDMTGIDLRGLDMSGCYLQGAVLERAIMFPLIVLNGDSPLTAGDLATGPVLQDWAEGKPSILNHEIVPTGFRSTIATHANFRRADLRYVEFDNSKLHWADFREAHLPNASFRGAVLERVDLRDAVASDCDFSAAQFTNVKTTHVDLRDSCMAGADLSGTHFDTTFLTGIQWDEKFVVKQESVGEYQKSVIVYRELTRAHTTAGDRSLAGEFHYREEEAYRKQLTAEISPRGANAGRVTINVARAGARGKFRSNVQPILTAQFARYVFGYGERPLRVLLGAALFIVLFSVWFYEWHGIDVSFDGAVEFIKQSARALYFSGVSFSALGYGEWVTRPTGWTRYLGVLESFVGVTTLALFLVTATRKWMR
ncbi:MAG: pentapeptide repeat-containing protein [Chloroflexi bacterium]|nr:pentapeptide repeat-containing protein [Chloroflexota bacterium]